jgi:hypothetical protein
MTNLVDFCKESYGSKSAVLLVIMMTTSRRMRLVVHVARTGRRGMHI